MKTTSPKPNWLREVAARNAEEYKSLPESIRKAAEIEHKRRVLEAEKRNLKK